MGLLAVDAGWMMYPQVHLGAIVWTQTTVTLDAAGEYYAMVFRAPKAGNLRSFSTRLSALANLPDNGLRFSFQDVSTSTGLPDGTADQSATIASGSLVANAWNDPGNFDADRAVLRGALVAAVVDFASFTAGDSVQVTTMSQSSLQHSTTPYGVLNGAKVVSTPPIMAVMYDDGTYAYLGNQNVVPAVTLTSVAYQVGTAAADEYGLTFSLPCAARCAGMAVSVALTAAGTVEFLLYEGTTVRRTATVDTDQTATTSARFFEIAWDDGPFDLVANTTYTVAMRPTTATNVTIIYATIPSLAIVEGAWPGGNDLYMSRRVDQGAWTHYNNATDGFIRPNIAVLLSGFSVGSPFVIGG